mmetsp:Transcript_11983/g.37931  ORF Transcript_11983/g.37931 Transcript_11983/m.37931 type:complete len:214 (-) Transcript_11983:471-1112(-)
MQSTIIFMSPGFSRLYMPSCSSSCRTISLVTWSPHSLMLGIEMSSTNTAICLPPGGPKVRPWRFSTEPSTDIWKMPGVVREEKVMVLLAMISGLKDAMNCMMVLVLAVPGPPTSRLPFLTLLTRRRRCSRRTESSVGMTSCANLGFSSSRGYSQEGTCPSQCSHSVFSSFTRYSNTVSPSTGGGRLSLCLRSSASNFTRSLMSSSPPMDQVRQ